MQFTYPVTQNCEVSYYGSEKKMMDFNKKVIDKIGPLMTIRTKEVRDKDFIFSYDSASKLDSEYILKTIIKYFIERKGREKEDSNLLIYEQFDTTFKEWLKVNEFVKEDNLRKAFL